MKLSGYFTFKGVASREFGILERIPMKPKPIQSYETIKIPGRATPISRASPEFEPITINAVLGIKDKTKISAAYAWLHGSGDLVFSDDLARYYKATCYADIVPEYLSQRFGKLPLKFICEPFMYNVTNTPITLTTAGIVTNNGTIYAQPIYKITGSGNINLVVNNETLAIKDVDGYITIDTSRMLVYKDNNVLVNNTTGFLPFLAVGDNNISWTGTVSSVEITKNERWL